MWVGGEWAVEGMYGGDSCVVHWVQEEEEQEQEKEEQGYQGHSVT